MLCSSAGVAPSTLAYWVRVGLVGPSVIGSSGNRYERWWSLSDVVAVKTVKALRDSGCPLQKVRAAVKLLASLDESLSSTRLVWDGSDVFLLDSWGKVVSAIREPGQSVLQTTVLPLGHWEKESEALAEDIRVRSEKRRRKASRSRRIETSSLRSG